MDRAPSNRDHRRSRDWKYKSTDEFSPEQVTQNPIFAPRQTLVEFLLTSDFEVISALGEVVLIPEEGKAFAEALLNFFEIHKKTDKLFQWAVAKEIQKSSSTTTLFRSTCEATKLMSVLYLREGRDYLKYIVGPLVKDISSSGGSFEIDPIRAEPGVDVKSNLKKLMGISLEFLSHIYDSVPRCPRFLRRVLYHARIEIQKKFPEASSIVVGVFLFSRFLIPAIVSPASYNLLAEPLPKEGQRGLILISKLLQNLANGNEFDGTSEEYKAEMNVFVTENTSNLQEFSSRLELGDEELAAVSDGNPKFFSVSNESEQNAISIIYDALNDNEEEIYQQLTKPETKKNFIRLFGIEGKILHRSKSTESVSSSWRRTPGKKKLEKYKQQLATEDKLEQLLEDEMKSRRVLERQLNELKQLNNEQLKQILSLTKENQQLRSQIGSKN